MLVNSCEASYLSHNPSLRSFNHSSTVSTDSETHGSTTRAIFTVHVPSFQILVVNAAACQLMNYTFDELCSMKLANLITDSYKHKLSRLYEKFLNSDDDVPSDNEKLLEFIKKDQEVILVSVYLKKLDNPERCLVLVKGIDRKRGSLCVDKNGKILSCDEGLGLIFQYDASEIVGLNICSLLPTLNISKEEKDLCMVLKQQVTGRTKKGDVFPLSLTLTCENPGSEEYDIVISVVTGLHGLILLNKKLLITNCNKYFIKLFFGFSKKDVLNMPIMTLIPTFCKDIGFEASKKCRCQSIIPKETNLSHCCGETESRHNSSENWTMDSTLTCYKSNSSLSFTQVSDSSRLNEYSGKNFEMNFDRDFEPKPLCMRLSSTSLSEDHSVQSERNTSSEGKSACYHSRVGNNSADKKNNTTDSCSETFPNLMVQEGKFLGFAQHRDGNYMSVKYEVKTTPGNDENIYCVWMSSDRPKISDLRQKFYPRVIPWFNTNSIDGSLERESVCSGNCTRPSTASIISQCDENLTAGDYSKYYTNIRQIGKGAFGYVKMAFRNADGLLVVTKFTKKQTTNLVSWVFHSNLNLKIPLEIGLLTTLHHPNIVKVLDVFHNDHFVQLVMEKHGAGFDLFEFINRGPKCDEKLKSYIYRQIISAVHYLNSLGILHRDIKDENVIINEKFEIKLIDFGSATFMPQNETFSKFYGTVEYCSPEVLQGSPYKGPELEIWALGVTLYVLTFGENPFYNVQETIQGQFSIPFSISEDLNDLLHHMLDKNVETRITIDEVVEHPWVNQPVAIENYKFEDVVRCSKEEAYPPKFVHEIHPSSEDRYSKDSRTYSNNNENTSNSNGSLSNLSDLDEFDDNFEEIPKCSLSELVERESTLSSTLFTSTPMQCKNDRLCKSATAVPNRLMNCSAVSERNYKCQEGSFAGDGLFLMNNYTQNLKTHSPSENESDSFEEN